MSWYASEYRNRWPICTDGSAADEWSIVIPKNWDFFWNNISDTTNGYDIVITDQSGETLEVFDLSGFNHSTKTVTIRLNSANVHLDANEVHWIYWNHSGTASDLSGLPTTVALSTLSISLVDPTSAMDVSDFAVQRPGSSTPRDEIAKSTSDTKTIWIRIPPAITSDRMHSSESTDKLYEVFKFKFEVRQTGTDSSLDQLANNRIVEDRDGSTWVGCYLKSGGWTDANDYTGNLAVTLRSLSDPNLLIEHQFLIKCIDPSEA